MAAGEEASRPELLSMQTADDDGYDTPTELDAMDNELNPEGLIDSNGWSDESGSSAYDQFMFKMEMFMVTHPRTTAIYDAFQVICTLAAIALYVFMSEVCWPFSCEPAICMSILETDYPEVYTLDLACACLFLFDVFLRLLLTRKKWDSINPSPENMYNNKSYEFWIDIVASVPTIIDHAIWSTDKSASAASSLGSFRVLRLFRLLRVLRVWRLSVYVEDARYHQIAVLLLQILILFFVFAGLIQEVECGSPDPGGSRLCEFSRRADRQDQKIMFSPVDCFEREGTEAPMSLGGAMYFVLVTMSTVGYGDIYPKTQNGRLVTGALILITMSVIPYRVSVLMNILADYNPEDQSYKPLRNTPHVVVCGHSNFVGLKDFLLEFFHENHGEVDRHVVLCFPHSMSDDLKSTLSLHRFIKNTTYLRGDMTEERSRERVGLRSAKAVFVLANNHTQEPDDEDVSNLLQTLAVENSYPEVKTFVQVIKPETAAFVRSAGGDYVITLQGLRMKFIGQNMVCPGVSTIFHNLFTSGCELNADGRGDASDSALNWVEEYLFGANNEIYHFTSFPDEFIGLTFQEAVLRVKGERNGMVLFLIRCRMTNNMFWLSNKTKARKISSTDMGYVLAENMTAVRNTMKAKTNPEHMKLRRPARDDSRDAGSEPGVGNPISGATPRSSRSPRRASMTEETRLASNSLLLSSVMDEGRHQKLLMKKNVSSGRPSGSRRATSVLPTRSPPMTSGCDSEGDPEFRLHSSSVNSAPLKSNTLPSRKAAKQCSIGREGSFRIPTQSRHLRSERVIDDTDETQSVTLQRHIEEQLKSHEPEEMDKLAKDIIRMSCESFAKETVHVCEREGDPHVIITGTNCPDMSLCSLLSVLRGAHLQSRRRIVLLFPAFPKIEVAAAFAAFQDVFFIIGSPKSLINLEKAGIRSCNRIVTLTNPARVKDALASTQSSHMDYEVVQIDLGVQRILGETVASKKSHLQMVNPVNLQYLRPTMPRQLIDEFGASTLEYAVPCYAAGRIYCESFLDQLVFQAYFNPHVIQIVEVLCGEWDDLPTLHFGEGPNGGERKIKRWSAELDSNLPHIYTCMVPTSYVKEKKTWLDVFSDLVTEEHGIALGLLRDAGTKGSLLPYVYTTPQMDTRLVETDRIFFMSVAAPVDEKWLPKEGWYGGKNGSSSDDNA